VQLRKRYHRIGASRPRHIASIQQVPISFFFQNGPGPSSITDEPCDYVSSFLATPEGIALTKAYKQIENAKLRRAIVALVKQIAREDEPELVTVRIISSGAHLAGHIRGHPYYDAGLINAGADD
jgi:hypothetical protein